METYWVLSIAVLSLVLTGLFYHRILTQYVSQEYGQKWLSMWGNKLYFWQSLIFMSMASTVLLMYLLKWSSLLQF